MRKPRNYRAEYERLKQRAIDNGFTSVRSFKRARKAEPARYYAPVARSKYKERAAQDWSDRRARMPVAVFDYDQYVEDNEGDPDYDYAEYLDAYYAAFVVSYDDDRDEGSEALYHYLVEVMDWEEQEYNDKYNSE